MENINSFIDFTIKTHTRDKDGGEQNGLFESSNAISKLCLNIPLFNIIIFTICALDKKKQNKS